MSYLVGDLVNRPWGAWEVLAKGDGYVVKRVSVEPGKRLSLQYHRHRQELWTIVAGSGEVELDGARRHVGLGDQVQIPAVARHRIAALGAQKLVFIEVQFGAHLDEADIVRLEATMAGRLRRSTRLRPQTARAGRRSLQDARPQVGEAGARHPVPGRVRQASGSMNEQTSDKNRDR